MSIKLKILLFFFVLTFLLIALTTNLWLMINNAGQLTELQIHRYDSHMLAEELRQSSDELTRMARTYTATDDKRFLDYYNIIVAIRDGKHPRPDNYHSVFWDSITASHNYTPGNGRKISIIDMMKELNFSSDELNLLARAKEISDSLINMEVQAFNAMKGIYKDEDGNYSIKGNPDQQLAIKIVHSPAYHTEKAAIMKKINKFFKILDTRTHGEVETKESLQKAYFIIAIILSVLLIMVSIYGYYLFSRDIVYPLNVILNWVKRIENGDYAFSYKKFKKDEFGKLAHAFAGMAEKVFSRIHILENATSTDPLTQINNRPSLDRVLFNELYKFKRYMTKCSIILIDIDHFKNINDKYGHIIGDKVLVEIAGILLNSTRESDVVGRWGGEEFMVICPNTALENCRILAELIRKRINEHNFPSVGNVTASLGTSSFEQGSTIEKVFYLADQALFKAKNEGRNKVY